MESHLLYYDQLLTGLFMHFVDLLAGQIKKEERVITTEHTTLPTYGVYNQDIRYGLFSLGLMAVTCDKLRFWFKVTNYHNMNSVKRRFGCLHTAGWNNNKLLTFSWSRLFVCLLNGDRHIRSTVLYSLFKVTIVRARAGSLNVRFSMSSSMLLCIRNLQ